RRRLRHVLAPRRLGVDDHPAPLAARGPPGALLAPGRTAHRARGGGRILSRRLRVTAALPGALGFGLGGAARRRSLRSLPGALVLGRRPGPIAGGREGLQGILLLDARGGDLRLDSRGLQRGQDLLAGQALLLGDLMNPLFQDPSESSTEASDSSEGSAPTRAVSAGAASACSPSVAASSARACSGSTSSAAG